MDKYRVDFKVPGDASPQFCEVMADNVCILDSSYVLTLKPEPDSKVEKRVGVFPIEAVYGVYKVDLSAS